MAIQMRRGAYSAFDPSKMVPGELAAVLSGDPAVTDGKSLFVTFAAGDVKRLATWEDAAQLIAAALADGKRLVITSGNDAISVSPAASGDAGYTLTHRAPFSEGMAGLDPASTSIDSGKTALGTTQLGFGDGFWVPCLTIDRYGHATGITYRKLVLPQGGLATEDKAGMVRPDGVSITVDASGVVRALRPPVDDALSDTSVYAVQNKVVKGALDLKAPLASPALTGEPTAPTAATGTNTAQVATTAFVQAEIRAGHRVLQWDSDVGEYTPDSVHGWLAGMNDGKTYGVSVPRTNATDCAKLAANAGIAAPTPGYVGCPAVDPYAGLGPFAYFLCNGYVDEDGYPHVTAIEGDGRFARDGSNGNVWNLHAVIYGRVEVGGAADAQYISNGRLAGMRPHPQCILPNGELRPFMLTPAYPLGTYDGKPSSVSGVRCRTRDVSHDTGRTICDTAHTGYALKSTYDDWYAKTMYQMKYGSKHSQGTFAGCSSYNLNYAVTVAETGTKRAIVSKANAANLVVGSSVSLGSSGHSNSVLSETRILSIEDYDTNNSAVNLDAASTFTTTSQLKLSTGPWFCGCLDAVEGDGAISRAGLTNGKEPFKLQGIELAHGMTEILGNAIVTNDGSTGWVPYVNHDSRNEATSLTASYKSTGHALPTTTADGWKYPSHVERAEGLSFGTDNGGSQTTGICDGYYTNKMATTGLREWLGLGYLSIGANAGLWCVDVGSGLTHAYWYIGSRLSATGRALTA